MKLHGECVLPKDISFWKGKMGITDTQTDLWSLFTAEVCEGPLKLKTILIKLLLPIFILNQFPLLAWAEISKVINASPVNSMWEKVHKHLFLKKIYVQILAFFLERLMIDVHSRILWGWGMGHFVKYKKHCPCRRKANK